jgi:hypothetical protein
MLKVKQLTVGRKTGLTVPDSGIRDEHGLEPMDHLFSSPEKPKSNRPVKIVHVRNLNATLSSEEDMDMGHSTSQHSSMIDCCSQHLQFIYLS